MSRPFDFDTQLRAGQWGEEFLLRAHDWLKPSSDRRWDLVDTRPPFKRVEVKTDGYPMLDTPNFFMEKSTVVHGAGKAVGKVLRGGPWRAAHDQVDTFVMLFRNGGTKDNPSPPVAYWWEDVPALVAKLEELVATRPRVVFPRRIRNLRVSAQGYLVERELLAGVPGVMMISYEEAPASEEESE